MFVGKSLHFAFVFESYFHYVWYFRLTVLSFITLEMSFYWFLACTVSENSVHHVFVPLYIMFLFCLGVFKIFSLGKLIMMCLGLISFTFSSAWGLLTLDLWVHNFHQISNIFLSLFLEIRFFVPSRPPPLDLQLHYTYIICVCVSVCVSDYISAFFVGGESFFTFHLR